MLEPGQNPGQTKYGLLSLLLLAILAGAFAAAAWVVYDRGGAARDAAELLQKVRQDGLAKYFPKDEIVWYVTEAEGPQPVPLGWSCSIHRAGKDGGFSGKDCQVYYFDKDVINFTANWTLNANATVGQYDSSEKTNGQVVSTTGITLADGNLTVRHKAGRADEQSASAAAPDNYIPEGLSELMLRLTSDENRHLAFNTVFDDRAIADGQLKTATVFFKPHGPNTVIWDNKTGEGRRYPRVYLLDGAGQIVQVEKKIQTSIGILPTTESRCSLEQLLKIFPQDEELRAWVDKAVPDSQTTSPRRSPFRRFWF